MDKDKLSTIQVFRLMDRPDRVIAFDSIPDALLEGFEMVPAGGFPRHWKEWMGKREKKIKIPPERDQITGQVRTYTPIIETDHFFYVVDGMIQPIVEKWKALCDYVAENKEDGMVLKENLADMALPLAPDQLSPLSLEPEDVPVIKLKKAAAKEETSVRVDTEKAQQIVKCDAEGCNFEATGPYAKNSVRMHKTKKHQNVVA